MVSIVTTTKEINIRLNSNAWFIGSSQISLKKFQRPNISTQFQKIITAGIAYRTAGAILAILIKRINK
jgi:hypothetical protein